LQNPKENRNSPPDWCAAATAADDTADTFAISIFAEFVSGNWQARERFQELLNQAGRKI